jgi:hypothetical protein
VAKSARLVYLDELNDRLDYPGTWHPLWDPGTPIVFGSVGRIKNGAFAAADVAVNRGVKLPADRQSGPTHSKSFTSASGVSMDADVSGSTDQRFSFIGSAAAGVIFSFAAAESIALVAENALYTIVPAEKQIAERMKEALDGKRMMVGDVLVTGLLEAESGIVLISGEGTASVEATTNVNLGKGPVDIGKVSGKLSVAHRSNMQYWQPYPEGLVLAYKGLKIVDHGILFVRWRPEVVTADADDSDFVMRW